MRHNSVLQVWHRVTQNNMTLDCARQLISEQARAGNILASDVLEVGRALARVGSPPESASSDSLALAALLLDAVQHDAGLREEFGFGAALTLWEMLPSRTDTHPHLRLEATEAALACMPNDLDAASKASLLAHSGCAALWLGMFERALERLQAAATILRRLYVADPTEFGGDLASVLHWLGTVHHGHGNGAEAESLLAEAEVIREQWEAGPVSAPGSDRSRADGEPEAPGERDVGTEQSAGSSDTGRDARGPAEQTSWFRPEMLAVGLLIEQGDAERQAGHLDAAEAAYLAAVDSWTDLSGARRSGLSWDLAASLHDLALALAGQGALEAARDKLMLSLRVSQSAVVEGDTSPKLQCQAVGTMSSLGLVLRELGDLEAAQGMYEQALALLRTVPEVDRLEHDRQHALILNNYGHLLRQRGQRREARTMLEMALAVRRRLAVQAPDRFERDVASTCLNLGALFVDVADRTGARAMYEEAAGIYCRLADAGDAGAKERLVLALGNLGELLGQLGDGRQSLALLRQACLLCASAEGGPSGTYTSRQAWILTHMGTVLTGMRRLRAARAVLTRAISLYEALPKPCSAEASADWAIACANLGAVALEEGDPSRARSHLEEGLALKLHSRPTVGAGLRARLARALYEQGETRRGIHLAWEVVDEIEASVRGGAGASVRHSHKQDVEQAYMVALCDRQLDSDLAKTWRAVEALREGQRLARHDAETTSLAAVEPPPDVHGGVLLAMQETADGMLFVLNPAQGDVVGRAGPEWVGAAGELMSMVVAAESREPRPTGEVAAAGHQLWRALPRAVQDLLSAPPVDGVTLSLDPRTSLLPFELLTPTGRPESFLGLRLALARVPGETLWRACAGRAPQSLSRTPRALLFGVVFHPGKALLEYVEPEIRALCRLLAHHGFALPGPIQGSFLGNSASKDSFLRELDSGAAVVHFAGHGQSTGDAEGLLLWDKDVTRDGALFGDELAAALGSMGDAPLVFLNACRAGRLRADGGAFRGLPVALLELGASVVIASPLLLGDQVSFKLAEAFYEAFLSGRSAGEAIIAARHCMFEDNADCRHWGRVMLYGNSHARLEPLPPKAA